MNQWLHKRELILSIRNQARIHTGHLGDGTGCKQFDNSVRTELVKRMQIFLLIVQLVK